LRSLIALVLERLLGFIILSAFAKVKECENFLQAANSKAIKAINKRNYLGIS